MNPNMGVLAQYRAKRKVWTNVYFSNTKRIIHIIFLGQNWKGGWVSRRHKKAWRGSQFVVELPKSKIGNVYGRLPHHQLKGTKPIHYLVLRFIFYYFKWQFITKFFQLKEMYRMITLGGDAELEQVDSLDPFEGIIFSVRPPKKSWKNISNLSGGEKTLSSLALVFALHHFKVFYFFLFLCFFFLTDLNFFSLPRCTWWTRLMQRSIFEMCPLLAIT